MTSKTKYHSLGTQTETHFLSDEGRHSETKVLAGWVSGSASLLGLKMATLSLSPHMAFPPGCVWRERDLWGLSSCKETGPIGSGPHTYDLNLNYLLKDSTSK